MLTMLWIYNFILIFGRVSFQYAGLPDTSCEHPSHYTVLFGLQKDIQGMCHCETPDITIGTDTFASQNFTFEVNSLSDEWTLKTLSANETSTMNTMGTPQLSVDVMVFLLLLVVHAIIKTEAWGTFSLCLSVSLSPSHTQTQHRNESSVLPQKNARILHTRTLAHQSVRRSTRHRTSWCGVEENTTQTRSVRNNSKEKTRTIERTGESREGG